MSLLATAAAGTAVLVAGAWWRARPAAVRNDGRTPCARGTAASPRALPARTSAALLDSLAAEVRAGSALGRAWQQSLCRHPLRGRAVSPDRPLDETLRLDASSRDEAVVLQVVGAAAAMGGPMALTIDAGASLLRERAASGADAIAHAAQARLSARVLTVVPVGFAAWSALTSGSFRTGIASAAGAASATIGAVLNGIGWWWMRSLVARAAP